MKIPEENTISYASHLSTLWLDHEGILYSVFKDVPRTLDNCKGRIELIKALTKDKPVFTIMDVSKSGLIEEEALKLLKQEYPKMYKAVAIVAASPVGKMIATHTAQLAPSSVPTKIFSESAQAKLWLKQFST